jgi:riboflavin kinase/FMN adenylyltransferase
MTIGTFDGLHLGHRAIVDRLLDRAAKTGARSLVYSFFPPPWRVLGTRREDPYLILTLQDKADLLHRMGVDLLVTEEFRPELQRLSHHEFADRVLRDRIAPKEIHVGHDFRFGNGRQGDWRFLARWLTNTEVRPHGAVRIEGEIVGCSMIRRLVREGQVQRASMMLGRRHFVRGSVIRGRGRGRGIGFPTANLEPSTELLPPSGVYAVEMHLDGETGWRPGVCNIGFRPTFAERELAIETHLFDYDGDLYGRRVRLGFVQRLRDEIRFDSVDALVAQIHQDGANARAMLPYPPVPTPELSWDPKPR